MARPEKVAAVESLATLFVEARSVVLNDFTGLDVEKISELRKQCREAGVEYRVIKNTLARRSVQNSIAQLVTGPPTQWSEMAFSIYYVLLFAITAIIVFHFHSIKVRHAP